MVQSINPVVYGDSRRTWIDAAVAHIVGGAAGGGDFGKDRSDWGFDADGQCGVWARVLCESYARCGLREYGEGWGEYEDVS